MSGIDPVRQEGEMTATLSQEKQIQHSFESNDPEVLTSIYQEDNNIVVWQRLLSDKLTLAVDDILNTRTTLQTAMTVTTENTFSNINRILGETDSSAVLSHDITKLVDMFCCLFDLKRVGLRLTTLDRAMCPRFHVDKVPCRLVTTYQGIATEWLPNHLVDRSQLGAINQDKPDEKTGIFQNLHDIHRLKEGDVALMKGELWEGNKGAGLVHRSPPVPAGERRLLLTFDFIT